MAHIYGVCQWLLCVQSLGDQRKRKNVWTSLHVRKVYNKKKFKVGYWYPTFDSFLSVLVYVLTLQ